MTTTPAASGADLGAAPRPTRIIDGFKVEPCAWPSAMHLVGSGGDCTGVHVGGRIVLTAAHCLDHFYDTEIPCEMDSDCPTADEFDNPLDLSCGNSGVCGSHASLVVNKPPKILFGEDYPNSDGHPRRTIPTLYCRMRSLGEGTTDDFGYCVLSEDPAVQPVPIVMHYEVDELLTQGTPLVAVGFGLEDMLGGAPSGTKHYLLSTLKFDASSMGSISLTEWVGTSPSAGIWQGDSGGPLFAQLPDGTWRVSAVASRAGPFYEPVWRHVPWMLEDTNVAAQQDTLIPCHTPMGQWDPTEACGQFPLDPDLPSGDWTRGPFACYHENVSGPSATCGEPLSPFNIADQAPAPPHDAARPPGRACVLEGRRCRRPRFIARRRDWRWRMGLAATEAAPCLGVFSRRLSRWCSRPAPPEEAAATPPQATRRPVIPVTVGIVAIPSPRTAEIPGSTPSIGGS